MRSRYDRMNPEAVEELGERLRDGEDDEVMPIRAENKGRCPHDWANTSHHIKDRAGEEV